MVIISESILLPLQEQFSKKTLEIQIGRIIILLDKNQNLKPLLDLSLYKKTIQSKGQLNQEILDFLIKHFLIYLGNFEFLT